MPEEYQSVPPPSTSADQSPPMRHPNTLENPTQSETALEKKLEAVRDRITGEVAIEAGVPVFTLEQDISHDLREVTQFYGPQTVYRIINANFVPEALEFGTDKARVEEHDFRRVSDRMGYDIWGVEDKAVAMGLRKSDAFCGTAYAHFMQEIDEFNTNGGIPEDRAAILVFDATKVERVEESDGFMFRDPSRRKEALLGVVKFKEHLVAFEERLVTLGTIDEKVALLEEEVFQHLNTQKDLEVTPYIAINLITLLNQASIENATNPSPTTTERLTKLRAIADRLAYETQMINRHDSLESQITMTRDAFAQGGTNRLEFFITYPDFVIKKTREYPSNEKLHIDEKHRDRFLQLIQDAEKCKTDLGIKTD